MKTTQSQFGHTAPVPVLFEKTHPLAYLPQRMRQGDAGFDLRAFLPAGQGQPCWIAPGGRLEIRTGVRCRFPAGWAALIQERSSLGRQGLFTVGNVIDEGYTGEVHVVLVNLSGSPYMVEDGERVAQIVLFPRFVAPSEHLLPVRGSGGFGSTEEKDAAKT